jgi:hypothetical protein
MPKHARRVAILCLLALNAGTPDAEADIAAQARCQRTIARAGANFAQRTILATLKCTQESAECQIQCDLGAFGPPCDTNPPPCCDPEDPGSNAAFGSCMAVADQFCQVQTFKIAEFEFRKQRHIRDGCRELSVEELCGSQFQGLNFAALNAGCLALDPTYVCNLDNLVQCVGGPLERALVDQISALLAPTAGDAVAALDLQTQFADIPIPAKVKGEVVAGKADVYAFTGNAGDEIVVTVRTTDDTGDGASTLSPSLTLLGADATTPVGSTDIQLGKCSVQNVCGTTCPQFTRRLPFDGTFHLVVGAAGANGCTGGRYRLVVVSPSGAAPVLVSDDVDASLF